MLAIGFADFEKAREWYRSDEPLILVEVRSAKGSTPREEGSAMVVARSDIAGTIGGGQLEWRAIETARQMLSKSRRAHSITLPLGPEIGQCCGGRVDLAFQVVDKPTLARLEAAARRELEERREVFVFGAGHTGQALARSLALLPLRIRLVDTRKEFLDTPLDNIEQIASAVPESLVEIARPGAAFVVMTHEHALDFLITAAALARSDTAYCGMIGSATKRGVFCNWLKNEGHDPRIAEKLTCPIGSPDIRDKRPEIIAALTAAEIIAALHRDQGPGTRKASR